MRFDMLVRRRNAPTPTSRFILLGIDNGTRRDLNHLVLRRRPRWVVDWREVYMARGTMPPGRAGWDIRDICDERSRHQRTPNGDAGEFDIVVWKCGFSYDLSVYNIAVG
jgi:hypothetical protein